MIIIRKPPLRKISRIFLKHGLQKVTIENLILDFKLKKKTNDHLNGRGKCYQTWSKL